MEDIKYGKGGNKGSVSFHPNQSEPYLAVTAVKSGWYKTLRGAKNFMTKNGYEEVKG
jgi:hypothetical protein